jgi:hypothetical protein
MTAELQKNIEDIAKDLSCIIVQESEMAGMHFVEEEPPRIEGPIIENIYSFSKARDFSKELNYYIMLHELGHVYHGHTQGRPPFENKVWYFENGVLRSEAEAWKFALDNAIIKPNEEDVDFMVNYCILSYYNSSLRESKVNLYNGNRHWHNGKYAWDEADEYFWNVLQTMKESYK